MSKLFPNAKGDKTYLRKRLEANAQAGEKLVGSEFWVVIEGSEDLSILVRTAQLPEMTREDVEDYAPSGVKINAHGVVRNQTEFQMQLAETINGKVLSALRSMVFNKEYKTLKFYLASESTSGEGTPIRTMEYCKLSCDAVDFASEDVSQVVRPSIRVVCNWQE